MREEDIMRSAQQHYALPHELLMKAIRNKKTDPTININTIHKLIEYCDYYLLNSRGVNFYQEYSPIEMAAILDDIEVIDLLVENGARINVFKDNHQFESSTLSPEAAQLIFSNKSTIIQHIYDAIISKNLHGYDDSEARKIVKEGFLDNKMWEYVNDCSKGGFWGQNSKIVKHVINDILDRNYDSLNPTRCQQKLAEEDNPFKKKPSHTENETNKNPKNSSQACIIS